ncbi:hypothetical protein SRB5_34910 [Streptomyces sp. RB5]|uniref:DUF4253 domain-containing protein n=1 Tax=Streptomyces smaragdinus TaxID=2585196 RepID=A0A7K0CIN4_9ACTN|nr:DUF4253 domain-containing protein [Streptomyces smaragdinus]MQY13345.1 hypothetical protein [Streptomyces smaragdinus]
MTERAHEQFGRLPGDLPEGRLLGPSEQMQRFGASPVPVMWISSRSLPDAGLWWQRLHAMRRDTGLHPVLLLYADDSLQPREPMAIDPVQYLREEWQRDRNQRAEWASGGEEVPVPDGVEPWPDDPGPPFDEWPGPAPASASGEDPDRIAGEVAEALAEGELARYVALVPAERSADIPEAIGWLGMTNHTGSRQLSAVLRSWEDRFGARVVGMAPAHLYVSVAAPPTSLEQAQLLALEHYLLCPDTIDQNPRFTHAGYAEWLIDNPGWSFWWD